MLQDVSLNLFELLFLILFLFFVFRDFFQILLRKVLSVLFLLDFILLSELLKGEIRVDALLFGQLGGLGLQLLLILFFLLMSLLFSLGSLFRLFREGVPFILLLLGFLGVFVEAFLEI